MNRPRQPAVLKLRTKDVVWSAANPHPCLYAIKAVYLRPVHPTHQARALQDTPASSSALLRCRLRLSIFGIQLKGKSGVLQPSPLSATGDTRRFTTSTNSVKERNYFEMNDCGEERSKGGKRHVCSVISGVPLSVRSTTTTS